MTEFSSESSTRVDLAGGTLDLWPLYVFLNGAKTVNLSIDIKTRAHLKPRTDKHIIIQASIYPPTSANSDAKETTSWSKEYPHIESFLMDNNPLISLVQVLCRHLSPLTSGFELHFNSDSPVGAGLGGSSSLLITLLKVFFQWKEIAWTVPFMVELASNLEAQVLHTPTGTQDYYPALQNGLNVIDYQMGQIQSILHPMANSVLKDHLVLVYTGKPHHSGLNNWDVLKRAIEKDQQTLHALKALKDVSIEMESALLHGLWSQIPQLFAREYSYRVRLSDHFSSPRIEELKTLMQKELQIEAVKICGAGGGGSVLIWVEPEKRPQVIELCNKNNFTILDMYKNS